MELLRVCLKELCARADGQTFSMGGGRINSRPARSTTPTFLFVHDELVAFIKGDATLESFPDANERLPVYELVHQRMQDDEWHWCAQTAHSVCWLKSPEDDTERPRRAPLAFYNLLEMFGGSLPQPVPSRKFPACEACTKPNCRRQGAYCCGHYMRLDERIALRTESAQSDDNAVDRHYPERLMPLLNKRLVEQNVDGGLVGLFDRGKLVGDSMRRLERSWLTMASDIEAEMRRASAMAKRDRVMHELKEAHASSGVEARVIRFVKSLRPAGTPDSNVYVPELISTLAARGQPRAVGRHQELIQRIYDSLPDSQHDDSLRDSQHDDSTDGEDCYTLQLQRRAAEACARRDQLHEAAMQAVDAQPMQAVDAQPIDGTLEAVEVARLAAQEALVALHMEEEAQAKEAQEEDLAHEQETGERRDVVLRASSRVTAGRPASRYSPEDEAAQPQWASRKQSRLV